MKAALFLLAHLYPGCDHTAIKFNNIHPETIYTGVFRNKYADVIMTAGRPLRQPWTALRPIIVRTYNYCVMFLHADFLPATILPTHRPVRPVPAVSSRQSARKRPSHFHLGRLLVLPAGSLTPILTLMHTWTGVCNCLVRPLDAHAAIQSDAISSFQLQCGRRRIISSFSYVPSL